MEMTTAALAEHVRREFAKVVVGQNEVVDQLLLVVLARGHALIEGVPGLAKTLAVKSLAHIFHLQFQRVQCTPDLIPGDILASSSRKFLAISYPPVTAYSFSISCKCLA